MGIYDKKEFDVIQGEDKSLVVHLVDAETEEPVDLTSATEIKARFRKADGTVLQKLLSTAGVAVVSIAGAKIEITLTEADTALLLLGSKQDFEVESQVGTTTTIVKFPRSLTVEAKIA
jgi:hypothetical protein